MSEEDDEIAARGVVVDVLTEIEHKAKQQRRWGWILMTYVALVVTTVGGYGIIEISKFNQIEESRRGLESHRVRNEIYHDCLVDYMKKIAEAVGSGNRQELLDIKDTCPPPQTAEEIRNLPHES
jgi:hypothetical protein